MAKLANNKKTPKGWIELENGFIKISEMSLISEVSEENGGGVRVRFFSGDSVNVECTLQEIMDAIKKQQ